MNSLKNERVQKEGNREVRIEVDTKKEAFRPDIVAGVAMLSKDEAAAALMVSPAQLDRFRLCGLLKATKTGQGWRYSQDELKAFQRDLLGVDVSSESAMVAAVSLRKAVHVSG